MNRFLSFLLLLPAMAATAAQLSPDQALERALSSGHPAKAAALSEMPNHRKTLSRLADMHHVYGQASDGYYIFSRQEAEADGYVILGADDAAAPVIAIIDQCQWPGFDMLPENMKAYLEQYSAEINAAQNQSAHRVIKPASTHARQYIAPMTKTRWNQSAPFNNDCPLIDGKRCVTGCVATALAQVLAYHQWPLKANYANITYTTSDGVTHSRTIGQSPYDWANMLNDYSSAYTDAQAQAVAMLMADCGHAVEMNYGVNSSGAVTSRIAGKIIKYFDYDKSTSIADHIYYTYDEWQTLIYDQLTNVGPVLFSGHNDLSGHAFVCDGYSEDDLFHFNWGWGGSSDGWFRLSALDPSSQGIGGSSAGYSMYEYALIDALPNHNGQASDIVAIEDALTGGFFEDNALRINQRIGNRSNHDLSYIRIGMRIENANGASDPVIAGDGYWNNGLQESYGWNTPRIGYVPATLPAGTYNVYPIFRTSTDGEWKDVLTAKTGPDHLALVKDESGNLSVNVPTGEDVSIECLGVNFDTKLYKDKAAKMTFRLTNHSTHEYWGAIRPVLGSVSGNELYPEIYYGSMTVVMAPGETRDIEYIGSVCEYADGKNVPGKKDLAIIYNNENDFTLCQSSVDYLDATEFATLSASTIVFPNGSTNVDPNNMEIECTLQLKTGQMFFDDISFWIMDRSASSWIDNVSYPNLLIDDANPHTLRTTLAIKNAVPNHTYLIAIYQKDSDGSWLLVGGTKSFTTGSIAGISDLDADEDARIVYADGIVSCTDPSAEIAVFDVNGREVGRGPRIDLGFMPKGVYIAKATLNGGMAVTAKILK